MPTNPSSLAQLSATWREKSAGACAKFTLGDRFDPYHLWSARCSTCDKPMAAHVYQEHADDLDACRGSLVEAVQAIEGDVAMAMLDPQRWCELALSKLADLRSRIGA